MCILIATLIDHVIGLYWLGTKMSFLCLSTNNIYIFCRSSDEVLHILGNILGSLQRGRTSLIVPRKKAIDDLIKGRNMVIFYNNDTSIYFSCKFILEISIPKSFRRFSY